MTKTMNLITLSNGMKAKVDDTDFEAVSRYKWYFQKGYAATNIGKTTVQMQKLILDTTRAGLWCDHVNGDRLDNRRANLRLATASQNQHNRKIQKNNNTGYKGVCFDKSFGKYKASIMFQGKRISLKYHDTPEAAARAYDAKAKELFGEFARLNFPE